MSTQPHFPAAARQTGGADISAHNRRWHCISSNQSQAGPCVGPPMLHMEVEDPLPQCLRHAGASPPLPHVSPVPPCSRCSSSAQAHSNPLSCSTIMKMYSPLPSFEAWRGGCWMLKYLLCCFTLELAASGVRLY